jgi:hypothetical protein
MPIEPRRGHEHDLVTILLRYRRKQDGHGTVLPRHCVIHIPVALGHPIEDGQSLTTRDERELSRAGRADRGSPAWRCQARHIVFIACATWPTRTRRLEILVDQLAQGMVARVTGSRCCAAAVGTASTR